MIAAANGFAVATRDASAFEAAGAAVINPWQACAYARPGVADVTVGVYELEMDEYKRKSTNCIGNLALATMRGANVGLDGALKNMQ